MGLVRTVFHPDFQAHHLATVNSTHTGRVRIDRVLQRGDWTPTGGAEDTLQPLYLGPALISRMANPTRADFVQDTVQSQSMQVELPLHGNELGPFPDDFKWHDGDRVTVLSNTANPMMDGVQMYVHGWMGSTYGWARRLVCRTNTKQL